MVMSVTATGHNDPPRVVLEVVGAPAGAARLAILRSAGAFTQPVVSDPDALVGGQALVTDWAAAVGRQLDYAVHAVDSTGERLETINVTVPALTDTPESWVWISDPLDEMSPMLIEAFGDTGAQVVKPATIAFSYPLGAQLPRASIGTRRGISRFLLVAKAHDPQEQEQLDRLVTDAPVLCVRPGTTMLMRSIVPPVLYGVVAEPTIDADYTADEATFTLDLAPTNGPAVTAINAAWTWDHVFATGYPWTGTPSIQSVFSSWWDLMKGSA